jgi:hypothetical protein
MQMGYDLHFVDVNLNGDYDSFIDPLLFDSMLKEINECAKYSEACFLLVLVGNKYGMTPLPLELSKTDYAHVFNMAANLGIGRRI